MTDLRTFLSELALDPTKFAEFLRDPEAAMRDRGLNQEDREALLSGIPAMIWARLSAYLQFPPPYYTPALVYQAAYYPRPTFVTMPPLMSPEELPSSPVYYVTRAPLYVTQPPPLYIPASLPPHFVTAPPRPGGSENPPESPPPSSPRTRTRGKK